ncbi:sel1 repeat family protein [Jiangella asiatica]|uniref:Sel1 repeat family protein n=1 Tax=Jiangella asiatica TaxID=2530372 RepID=A0A4R5CJT8_9ACTN|nr:sel1 repeat family protein [Jiangella asiatica]TDE00512.1 sel1 repeat family protein [Jiangella asiatica]
MVNRGNRLRYVMWFVLAGVVLLLAALIVAIAMDVQISTRTSAVILAACGVISVALIVGSSRLTGPRRNGTDQSASGGDAGGPAAGTISNWMFLADAYVERGEFEAAEKLYRRAADAGHGPAMTRLGEVLYELGNDEEAAHYRRLAAESGD